VLLEEGLEARSFLSRPSTRHFAQVAAAEGAPKTHCEKLECNLINALTQLLSASLDSAIELGGDIPDRVLHALNDVICMQISQATN